MLSTERDCSKIPRSKWKAAERARWQELRTIVIERDGGRCKDCGKDTVTVGRVDFAGPIFDEKNLAVKCQRCLASNSLTAHIQPYPGPATISRPDDPASERQKRFIKRLGGNPEGMSRADAAGAIPQLILDRSIGQIALN